MKQRYHCHWTLYFTTSRSKKHKWCIFRTQIMHFSSVILRLFLNPDLKLFCTIRLLLNTDPTCRQRLWSYDRYRSSIIIIIFSTQMMHFHDLPGVIFARVTVQQNCRQHRPSFTDMLTDTQSTEHTCLNGHFSRWTWVSRFLVIPHYQDERGGFSICYKSGN